MRIKTFFNDVKPTLYSIYSIYIIMSARDSLYVFNRLYMESVIFIFIATFDIMYITVIPRRYPSPTDLYRLM